MPNILEDLTSKLPCIHTYACEDGTCSCYEDIEKYCSDKIRQVLMELEKPNLRTTSLFQHLQWHREGYNKRNAQFEADRDRILTGLERKE